MTPTAIPTAIPPNCHQPSANAEVGSHNRPARNPPTKLAARGTRNTATTVNTSHPPSRRGPVAASGFSSLPARIGHPSGSWQWPCPQPNQNLSSHFKSFSQQGPAMEPHTDDTPPPQKQRLRPPSRQGKIKPVCRIMSIRPRIVKRPGKTGCHVYRPSGNYIGCRWQGTRPGPCLASSSRWQHLSRPGAKMNAGTAPLRGTAPGFSTRSPRVSTARVVDQKPSTSTLPTSALRLMVAPPAPSVASM